RAGARRRAVVAAGSGPVLAAARGERSPRIALHPARRPPTGTDLLEDRLEQVERREYVLAREHPRTVDAAGRERVLDRLVLTLVLQVELVDRLVAGRPDRGAGERAPRALRHLLDVGQVGDTVDNVVEAVVAPHPLHRQRAAIRARL